MKTTTNTYNLLGLFSNGVALNRKPWIKKTTISIRLEPLTEEQESFINNHKNVWTNGKYIRNDGVEFAGNNILLYGDVELNNREFIDCIRNLDIINSEDNPWYRTDVNFTTGVVDREKVRKWSFTTNPLTWFEYNYMLIGRPNKIIIYECPSSFKREPNFKTDKL